MPIVIVHNLVNPKTGKTWKEENLELKHNIPVGSLVEVKFNQWFGDGACWKVHARLWVVAHDRDCDGEPMYTLSQWDNPEFALFIKDIHTGFSEKNLTVIELTEEIRNGYGSLLDNNNETD